MSKFDDYELVSLEAMKRELTNVAQAYCDRYGHQFLFVGADLSTFGYETNSGHLVHRSFESVAYELGYGR